MSRAGRGAGGVPHAGRHDARLGGLLLIAIGAVGMIRLLGFIALHLLGAELLSLLYLLLAPAAVLAPALGDGGRAAFRTWATRLVGAVCSKLVFSFLLGVVLLMTRTLMGLEALGWWTRWLLMAVLWWGAHRQRHHVLGLIAGEHRGASEHHRSLLAARDTAAGGAAHRPAGHTLDARQARRVQRQRGAPADAGAHRSPARAGDRGRAGDAHARARARGGERRTRHRAERRRASYPPNAPSCSGYVASSRRRRSPATPATPPASITAHGASKARSSAGSSR